MKLFFPLLFLAFLAVGFSDNNATISSFRATVKENRIFLDWTVMQNGTAERFEVEKSKDGKEFKMAALVFSTEKKDTDAYKFFEKKETYNYYRIKVINKNSVVSYSEILTAK